MILLKDLLPYRNKQVKLNAALRTSGNMLRKKQASKVKELEALVGRDGAELATVHPGKPSNNACVLMRQARVEHALEMW